MDGRIAVMTIVRDVTKVVSSCITFEVSWIVGDRGVPSVWRTSDIRAGIILEAKYQSQVGSHTYCLLCGRLGMLQAQ